MNARFLTFVNTVGCFVLISLVLLQWRKERGLESSMMALVGERDAARQEWDEVEARRVALERDVTALKDALTSAQQAAEQTAGELSAMSDLTTQKNRELDDARTQMSTWQKALAERDQRIQSLQADLATARTRLDVAIQRLKQAGAR
jgi:chromosome segregation ATPase